MSFPRLHSELSNQDETLSAVTADYRDYDAIAQAVRSLLHVQMFTAVIAENGDHVTVTHNLGSVPTAVVLAPVDDVGRCWYDMNTISATIVDVYVANPPLAGGYLIKVILYY
jgi:hypothetical protein